MYLTTSIIINVTLSKASTTTMRISEHLNHEARRNGRRNEQGSDECVNCLHGFVCLEVAVLFDVVGCMSLFLYTPLLNFRILKVKIYGRYSFEPLFYTASIRE